MKAAYSGGRNLRTQAEEASKWANKKCKQRCGNKQEGLGKHDMSVLQYSICTYILYIYMCK